MKHQMPAIQHGNGEKVQQANGGRQNRNKPDEVIRTLACHRARGLRNPNRSREVTARNRAGDHVMVFYNPEDTDHVEEIFAKPRGR